jgi:ketosteroid isomerase-like protein
VGGNLDTVRAVLEAWNAPGLPGDAALRALAVPELEVDLSENVLNPATFRGFDGFRRFVAEVHEVWAEFRMEPERLFDAGDHVVAFVHALGRGRGSGLEVDGRPAMVFGLRGGKVASVRVVQDREQALRSVGLSSESAR